jgi:2-polyprenyl-3-methyl-5-hydroxy-6-metoxy-1,4-benzoquinol methylase
VVYGKEKMNYKVQTDYPVALDSNDHLKPWGTRQDNHKNWRFNDNLISLVSERPCKVLDLGCAGGGMVQDLLMHDFVAIGLEGSDYNRTNRKWEWPIIPDNLFTCDISRPFTILENNLPMKFHVVTAWDVLEHMNNQERLDIACQNIVNHLSSGGYFICSMPANEVGPDYGDPLWHHIHFTTEQWDAQFRKFGLISYTPKYWHPCGWLRGEDSEYSYRKILKLDENTIHTN